jgi:hypothetical protein
MGRTESDYSLRTSTDRDLFHAPEVRATLETPASDSGTLKHVSQSREFRSTPDSNLLILNGEMSEPLKETLGNCSDGLRRRAADFDYRCRSRDLSARTSRRSIAVNLDRSRRIDRVARCEFANEVLVDATDQILAAVIRLEDVLAE